MIVITQGNRFPAESERSGRVRDIRDLLFEVLAAYDVDGRDSAHGNVAARDAALGSASNALERSANTPSLLAPLVARAGASQF